MLRSLYYVLRFNEPHPQTHHGGRSISSWSSWPTVIALSTIWGAFREGLAAHREYARLRSSGMSHDDALRAALGFGLRPPGRVRWGATPLHCAGKA
jgi:hypothetical protein